MRLVRQQFGAVNRRDLDALLDLMDEDVESDRGDLVFAALRAHGHGADSDLPLEDTVWDITRWRSGKCVWWCVVYTWDEALEAAGLRE